MADAAWSLQGHHQHREQARPRRMADAAWGLQG